MDLNLLEEILKDEELTAYLQYMVQMGCELDFSVYTALSFYFEKTIKKEELMDLLEFEINVHKEKSNVTTGNEVSDGGEIGAYR